MPSVDIMFSSLADIYGKGGLGIVLSGMGRDGLVGSARMIDQGGSVVVQDQETCAVWGMPRAVADAGLASGIMRPSELAASVGARARGASWK